MPESEIPERRQEIEGALNRLSEAVDTIALEVTQSRRRAEQAETEYGQLRQVVGDSGDASAGDLEERLKVIAAENHRLRETLAEARRKAERIRSRLAVVEDEV